MSFAARAFVTALCLAAAGGIAFGAGLGAAFQRAGNWSNHLALLGIVLLVVAGLSNVVAFFGGAVQLIQKRQMAWWWLFSALAMAASVCGGWVALHL